MNATRLQTIGMLLLPFFMLSTANAASFRWLQPRPKAESGVRQSSRVSAALSRGPARFGHRGASTVGVLTGLGMVMAGIGGAAWEVMHTGGAHWVTGISFFVAMGGIQIVSDSLRAPNIRR